MTSRAIVLVERLLRDEVFTEAELAREIVVRALTLADYRTAKEPMPLDRQLCLALVLTRLPEPYARMGRQFREQVAAAMRYELHVTERHDGPPLSFRRF